MSGELEFELVPIARLRAHEEVDPAKVRKLAAQLLASGVFDEPIWVARGSNVILNGHHRVAALRALGAERVPAWVVDYDGPTVGLDRWTPGPPITKAEVVRRAGAGELFPPRTTRHTWKVAPERRPTALADLGIRPEKAAQGRRSAARSPG